MKPPALTTKPPSSATNAQWRQIRDRREQRPMLAELYRRAEAQLRKRLKDEKVKSGDPKSEADPKRLFHELQVHQMELEMQNIELQKSRNELEMALESFTDLYDFAPVGYFTLTADSSIQQANLTGASLVGIDRSRLVGRCFDEIFPPGQRPTFRAFLKQVFAGPARQRGDFELLVRGQPPRAVNIEARRSPGGDVCRAAVVDIIMTRQPTPLLRQCRERGLQAEAGFEMLVQQVPEYLRFFGFEALALALQSDLGEVRALLYPK